jgi:L-lactate dehydrogenase complex protein LldG
VETNPGPSKDAPVSRPPLRGSRARDEILRRVGAALADRPQPGPIPRGYRRTGLPGDVIELFAERAAEYEASVRRITPDGLPAAIAEALRQRGARRIAVPPGLPGSWLSHTGVEVERHGDDPLLTVAQLERLDGVVTGCAVAIAETGTIILDAGPGQGRRVLTLLPDYHLCVVSGDQIVATLAEGLARLDPGRPQTWISGPSATSDIELDRVEGVHGPRTLHILAGG